MTNLKQKLSVNHQLGFSLIEVLLASSVFALLVTIMAGALIYSQDSAVLAGQRARAVLLAEEGLEAVRNIRDASFSNLVDGSHGLVISSNQWALAGSSDTTDIYTRQVQITTPSTDRRQIIATVTWQQNLQRQGSAVLITYLTNWPAATAAAGYCLDYCQSLNYTSGTCRQNDNQCASNSETYEAGGDTSCPHTGGQNVCCCLP